MKSRVIVLAPVDKPIFSAAEHGDIVFLFSPSDKPIHHTAKEFPITIIRKLEAMDYDPENDYILLVGAFVPLIVFVATVCDQYLAPKVLAYDMRQGNYYSIVLGIGDIPNEGVIESTVPTNQGQSQIPNRVE